MPHTPGPWTYQENSDAYTHIVRAAENRFICQLAQDTSGVAEGDARLIATAPELLEVCEAQHKAIDFLLARLAMLDPTFFPSQSGQPWEAVTKGHVAIAKARGETP